MVPYFMRDHVRLREVTRCVESVLHLLEEPEIQIDMLVPGAVERTDGRAGESAAFRRDTVDEQDERGFLYCRILRLKSSSQTLLVCARTTLTKSLRSSSAGLKGRSTFAAPRPVCCCCC